MVAIVKILEAANPGNEVIFPITPNQLQDTSSADPKSYRVIGMGGYSFPDGRAERHFSFSGYLPGLPRAASGLPHIHDWRAPDDIVSQVRGWLEQKTRLRYTTEGLLAGIDNVPVYLSKYTFTKQGPAGDVNYQLEFVEWRVLTIKIDDGSGSGSGSSAQDQQGVDQSTTDDDGTADPTPTTYTVQEGDNLSYIAKQFLGDTGRWTDIYDANKDTIGDNPNLIYPGQQLTIPGGTVADPNNDGYDPSGQDANAGPPASAYLSLTA